MLPLRSLVVLLLLLLTVFVVGIDAFGTDYVEMNPVESVLRIGDVAETMWIGVGADGSEPVVMTSWSYGIAVQLANLSCATPANQGAVTCRLPEVGQLTSSSGLTRNGSHVSLVSEQYSVSIEAELVNATWTDGFNWRGSGVLQLTVHEQTPEERQARVWMGIVIFLPTCLYTLLLQLSLDLYEGNRSMTSLTMAPGPY